MVHTQNYSTKTNFIARKNVMPDGMWGIALDIGYSGVKGMSPNMVYCFPSYARKLGNQAMLSWGETNPNDILYKDEDGIIWNVGQSAQAMIKSDDANESLQSLFGRNRYFSPMFKVLARTGLGIGMIANEFGNPNGKTLALQTGLPPAYLKSDVRYLKEVFSGHHQFELKVGSGQWQKFSFDLDNDNIRVIAQPMGSLISASLDNNTVLTPEAHKYLAQNVLVFDAGFGTLDIYSVRNRRVESCESYDDIGMKAVLSQTADLIFKKHNVEIPVHAMQKCLQDGFVKVLDRRLMEATNEDFSEELEIATKNVCHEALERIKQTYNYLIDYDYLLITGGTGAAWQELITEHFSKIEGLKIITGNQNDNLSHIFSNVRGYYLYQVGKLSSLSKQRVSNEN